MEIQTLAQNVVQFLTPFLPYLLQVGKKAGEKAIEEVGKKFGSETVEKAKSLWGKLRVNKNVERAAQDVAAMPDDPDAQAALRLQLKKLLKANESLAKDTVHLMENKVVQRVLAERGSEIRNVEQRAKGGGATRQNAIARGKSIIEDVIQNSS